MLVTQTKMIYGAFGLTFESELPLPELPHRIAFSGHADVEIIVDRYLKDTISIEPYDFDVAGAAVTVLMPDAAVFRIEAGKRIIVSPIEGADEDLIRLYVLGTCVGALLLQRSIYPLHGSAIAINGKAYAFAGHSGAGKSTLAAAFLSKGYSLLSDDVIALTQPAADKPMVVWPAYPQQKLWQQSLDAFGLENSELRSIYGREEKFCLPVEESFCSSPLPLGGVFELAKTDSLQVGAKLISKLERFDMLFKHTYRQFLIQKLGLTRWHFNCSAKLAAELPIYQISRPISGFTAPQLVDLILNIISTEE
ncbi:hypothetical protein BK133_09585 [Paenibacillus sp. FSL H8-0548]|uniref:hypothetical protein n=1 Tax=Paenibacillus sp. FSL H8-0548 TaxID=1920422 RepID=UPI00096D505D|nr:hypothetical protein [Paenibacillus sp. FSL H8-0548]OMF35934.1 hypothetical protein BK133_09585 [Paenibacillus sp. FSL H8-0548]